MAAGATLGAADLPTGLGAGLAAGFAAGFFSALRAGGAAFALAEDFDFAGIFLGFEAALAMACTQPARGRRNRGPYTILGGLAQVGQFRNLSVQSDLNF